MLLYCADESIGASTNGFFIFGGITVPDYAISGMVNMVGDIKKSLNLTREVEIKWNYTETAKQIRKATRVEITRDEHQYLKSSILAEIAKHGRDELGIFVYATPFKFFENNGWKSYQMAMNICFAKFERYLISKNQYGVVLIDELSGVKTKNEKGEMINLSRELLRGQILFYILNLYEVGTGRSEISRIPLIIPNVNSALSGLHQINDLVLGAFRYYTQYVFEKDNNPARKIAADTVRKLVRNIHVNFESLNIIPALNCGLSIYPQEKNSKWSRGLQDAWDLVPNFKKHLSKDFNIS